MDYSVSGEQHLKFRSSILVLACLLASGPSAFAKEDSRLISAVPAAGASPKPTVVQPPSGTDATANPTGDAVPPEAVPPAPASLYSAALEQALQGYRAAPGASSFTHVLETLRPLLSQPGAMRYSVANLVKDNPLLGDLKPRVIESSGTRIWTFPRAPERNQILLQWIEKKEQVVQVGRRKRVDVKVFLHAQNFSLPAHVSAREAGFMVMKDEGRALVLSGDGGNGSLWLSALRAQEGGWHEVPGYFDALPQFLIKNVSGHIGFRGSDLLFNIARMVESTDASGNKILLPEAESATYKFWVKPVDAGFAIVPSIPDPEGFSTVVQFMTAVQQGRTDSTRPMLSDPRLASIPKYLGLHGRPLDSAARVVQMAVPPGRGQRYRLTNIGKDDLIFDVAKVKGAPLVKAIFIAPPDPFLQETAKYFPLYARLIEADKEKEPAPAAYGGAESNRKTTKVRPGHRVGSASDVL